MTVHIVEDDDGVRDALSLLCHACGRAVRSHRDGESLLSAPAPQEGDVVLVDLSLPGLGGRALVDHLMALPTALHICIVTGLSAPEISRALSGLAAIPVVRKPLSADIIAQLF